MKKENLNASELVKLIKVLVKSKNRISFTEVEEGEEVQAQINRMAAAYIEVSKGEDFVDVLTNLLKWGVEHSEVSAELAYLREGYDADGGSNAEQVRIALQTCADQLEDYSGNEIVMSKTTGKKTTIHQIRQLARDMDGMKLTGNPLRQGV